MSLQTRTRSSFQTALDLHTEADELIEIEKKKKEMLYFVPLNVLLRKDDFQSFFFFGDTVMVRVISTLSPDTGTRMPMMPLKAACM